MYTDDMCAAGSWMFAAFMLACAAFGVMDALAEPSALTSLFVVSQVPFAAGAVLLADASSPEGINRASLLTKVWGEDATEGVVDELYARGLYVDASESGGEKKPG